MKAREARIQKVVFRRKKEGKTNYRRRIKLLLSGKPRFVIRQSLKNILCQIIEYSPGGDKVMLSATSSELNKFGWKLDKTNLPAAYLTGLLMGKKAKGKIKEAVLDTGLASLTKGSKIFACLKGAVDGGIKINYSEDIMPSQDRISGKHIADYSLKLKNNKELYQKLFSRYIKDNIDPANIVKYFEETRKKIIQGEK